MSKTLKFVPEMAEMIKQGTNRTTFRLFDDKDLSAGDELIFSTRIGEKITEFGKGIITSAFVKTLKNLTSDDFIGYESVESVIDQYKRFYGDKVNEDSEAKIIKFKVIEFF